VAEPTPADAAPLPPRAPEVQRPAPVVAAPDGIETGLRTVTPPPVTPVEPPAEAGKAPSRRGVVVAAAVAAALAIVGGAVAGRSGGEAEAPPSSVVSAGALSLRAPAGWVEQTVVEVPPAAKAPTPTAAPSDVAPTARDAGADRVPLPLRAPRAFGPAGDGGGLVAGMAAQAGFPPAGLAGPPIPVRLADVEALRYRGDTGLVYAVPTDAGTAVLVCRGGDRVVADCGATLESLRVEGARILPAAPDEAYADGLTAVVQALGERRRDLRRRLAGAAAPDDQAAIAGRLAEAHAQARAAVAELNAPAIARDANDAIAAALAGARSAYRDLAAAVAANAADDYDAAASAIAGADRDLDAALASLRGLGYSLGRRV
jgi:hypothetical protein